MNLKCDVDYTFGAAGKQLWIRFGVVYDRYTKYRKDYAIVGEVLTDRQFYKQLEHTDYFIAKNRTERVGGKPYKVWIIDYEKLSQVVDVLGFMTSKSEDEV